MEVVETNSFILQMTPFKVVKGQKTRETVKINGIPNKNYELFTVELPKRSK